MVSYSTEYNHNTAGIIKHSCGIIFILFSFFYLFFLQGEMLSKAQYVLSQGATTYSIFWGALIITAVLRLLQLPVERFVKVPIRFHALTYIPSMLFLTVLCDVSCAATEGTSSGGWWLGVLFILALFFALSRGADYVEQAFNNTQNYSNRLSPLLWPNFSVLMLVILCFTTCNSATDVNMYEQKTERLILEEKYEDALEIGDKSLSTNLRLTNLRMFALSKSGQLPERLFDFPQYYGSDGLLCVSDTNKLLYRFSAKDICSYLGVECDSNVHSTEDYFNSVLFRQQLVADSLMGIELERSENPDSLKNQIEYRYNRLKNEKKRIDDYILCGLLLDRNIDAFKQKINTIYASEVISDSVVPVESLPIAYREAMVMVYPEIGDTAMIKLYGRYLDLRDSEKDSTISSNITRRTKIDANSPRTFGNTFWWYYYNPKITHGK